MRSRHVTRIVDAQTSYVHDGVPLPYLVMELLEGRTLQELLDRRTRPARRRSARRGSRASSGAALAAAHERGIVHRDLKPSNVFIARDENGQPIVKLCDFGIAKLLGDAPALGSQAGLLTQTGAMLGTPMYLAPELLRGARDASPATDQWSLGLMAFRALAGIEYFGHVRGVPALVLAIATERLAPPSELAPHVGFSRAFDAWFLALVRARADRPLSRRGGAGRGARGRARQPAAGGAVARRRRCRDRPNTTRPRRVQPSRQDRPPQRPGRPGAGPPRASCISRARRCGRWSRSAGSPPVRPPATARPAPEGMNREKRRNRENRNPIRNPRIRNLQNPPFLRLLPVKNPEPNPAPAIHPAAPPTVKKARAPRATPARLLQRGAPCRRSSDCSSGFAPRRRASENGARGGGHRGGRLRAAGSARADAYDATLTRAIAAKERAMDVNEPARWEEALRLFQEADAIRATREASYELGHAAERLARTDLAVEAYEAALNLGLTGQPRSKAEAFVGAHAAALARVSDQGRHPTAACAAAASIAVACRCAARWSCSRAKSSSRSSTARATAPPTASS